MSLRQRRREVHIMNLIGTPPRTVRAPFLIESMFVTSVGAAIAAGALVAIVGYAGPTLTNAGGIRLAPVDSSAAIGISFTLWVGAVAATWAIGRVMLRRGAQQTNKHP
jgi:cell division protein FtsX